MSSRSKELELAKALGLKEVPVQEDIMDEETKSSSSWHDGAHSYKHDMMRNSVFPSRDLCVRSMARMKGKRIAGKVDGKWQLLDLYDHEKNALREIALEEANKKRYSKGRS